MKKYILIILALFSFSATNAEIRWELSEDGTLTISGTDMPDYRFFYDTNTGLGQTTAPWYSEREKIKKIVIEDGVTSIGEYAFDGCDSLTTITIPNSVTSIGDYAFDGCSGLTSITIPNSVTSIGDMAFKGCESLTSVTIPNSVTSIERYAFSDCSGLTSIIVEEGNAKYDSRDNCNAIIETKSNTLIRGCMNTIIPNSVTSIGGSAFFGCDSLTSITIPNSVTSIGRYAFFSCVKLESITIPNSVTRIGAGAFEKCTGLTSITIPDSVTSIGDYAFYGCGDLTSITFEGSTPPELGKNVFEEVNKSIPVYVPANSIEAYKKALGDYFEESSIRNK